MPSLKDISKLAGVSYGTVSNVLNKRGNVCLEKIKLVEDAALQLGYYKNERASALRSNKKNEIALIVPTLDDFALRRIYDLLLKKISHLNLKLNLYISDYNPIIEEEQFKLSIATNEFILIYTSITEAEQFYNNINCNRSKLIFINSYFKAEKENIFNISFDLNQLINDINAHIINNKYKKSLFFTDANLINKNIYEVDNLKTIICSQPFNLSTAIDTLSENSYDLIIVSSKEKYESIVSAFKILQKNDKTDFILISSHELDYHIKALHYYQNLNLLVEKIISIISSNKIIERQIFIPYSGFQVLNNIKNNNEFINILMIESPTTSALLKIKPFIEEQLGFKLNIDIIKYNQYDIIMDQTNVNHYDLIRIDMAYLPEIADSIFKPLSNNFSSFLDGFIDNLEEYTCHNGTMYTLPFDISCMLLMYRNDILENQLIEREYYEQTKNMNIVPQNYQNYESLELFFNKNYKNIFKSSTVCFGSNITCGNEFLIRVSDDQILDDNENLNLTNKKVVTALNNYLTSVSFSKNSYNTFWDDVIKEYSDGNVIMSLVYSNYIHMLNSFNKEIFYKTSYTFPPSMKSLIGGGVIGLTKNTKKEDLCHLFLKMLYDDKIGKLLTHLGGTMPMKSIYNDINLTFMYPWLPLIPKVLKNNTRKHYDKNKKLYKTVDYEKKIGKLVKEFISSKISHK